MRDHLNHISTMKGSQPGKEGAEPGLTNDDGKPVEEYSIIFRELFCIAAADLAEQLNQPLEDIGVLFDEILSTGYKDKSKPRAQRSSPQTSDIEKNGITRSHFGPGQLLFLIRRANPREAERLQAGGYRFAAIQNVADIVARSMQIHCDNLPRQLIIMREYNNGTQILEPGVYTALFAIRASVHGGFDVLVRKNTRDQLPTMRLPFGSLETWKLNYLSQLDGVSVQTCLKLLETRARTSTFNIKEQIFSAQLHDSLEALRDDINDPLFHDAVMIGKPVSAPCGGSNEDGQPSEAQLLALRLIMPIHSRAVDEKFEFIPLSFFKTQQRVYKNSPDHAMFARKIHREFGPILNQSREGLAGRDGDNKSRISSTLMKKPRLGRAGKSSFNVRSQQERTIASPRPDALSGQSKRGFRLWEGDSRDSHLVYPSPVGAKKGLSNTSSQTNLVETQMFGGIMVSQEVTVAVRELEPAGQEPGQVDEASEDGIEMVELGKSSRDVAGRGRMGTMGWASKEVEDLETYVDILFAICVDTR
jgi:hypothetical protein